MKHTMLVPAMFLACACAAACDTTPFEAVSDPTPQFNLVSSTSFSENFDRGFLNASGRLETTGTAPDYATGSAVFGAEYDWQRGYLRTTGANYAGVSFTADVTVTVPGSVGPAGIAFIGFGAGEPAWWFYREPAEGEAIYARILPNDFWGPVLQITDATHGGLTEMETYDVGGDGTHRMRMTWNHTTRALTFAIHANYVAGAEFVATQVVGPMIVEPGVFGAGNSRIFFGGAGGVTFDNLRIVAQGRP